MHSSVKVRRLLYLADREALIHRGRPITTDRYVSIDIGPVLSQVYSLVRDEPPSNLFRTARAKRKPQSQKERSKPLL